MSEQLIKSIFNWDHFSCYLAGAIEYDAKNPWREEWTKGLVEIGFDPGKIFNPQNKPIPKGVFEFDLDNESGIINEYRVKKDYAGLCKIMGQIMHVDLRLCDHAHLILANFTKATQESIQPLLDQFEKTYRNALTIFAEHLYVVADLKACFYELVEKYLSMRIPTFGTIHEVINATNQHKPTMIVWEGGKETCSGWLMGLVGHKNVFGAFGELKATLKQISEGKKYISAKEWLLLDFGKNGH